MVIKPVLHAWMISITMSLFIMISVQPVLQWTDNLL